jgi:hypothetical protein
MPQALHPRVVAALSRSATAFRRWAGCSTHRLCACPKIHVWRDQVSRTVAVRVSAPAASRECVAVHQPGDVFFCIAEAEPGSIEFTAVEGRIRVSGDCGFRSVSRHAVPEVTDGPTGPLSGSTSSLAANWLPVRGFVVMTARSAMRRDGPPDRRPVPPAYRPIAVPTCPSPFEFAQSP